MTEKKAEDDGRPAPFSGERWRSGGGEVEAIGAETGTEDLTPEDRRASNAKAAEMRQSALERAQQMADDGEGDDESDEGDARKD